MTERLLFISRSLPPRTSGSAHVVKALLEADVGSRLLVAGESSPLEGQASAGPVERIATDLRVFGRGKRFIEPLRILLRPRVTARLISLAQRSDVGRIVCVFPDGFYCEAALAAAERSGKPIDFWFHNTYADNRLGLFASRAGDLQSRMLRTADRLLFISDALMEWFLAKYPGIAPKCVVLRHPVGAADAGRFIEARGFSHRPVRATLIGNLNDSNLDAAIRMVRALGDCDTLRIALCTPVPRALLMARGMSLRGIDYLGYVRDDEMAGLLAETDLFLLPHGLRGGYSEAEYRTIFPTRAAYYLAHGRPILAHCPVDSGLRRFLDAHGCALSVSVADESAILGAFQSLVSDPALQLELALAASAASRLFEPRAILDRLTMAGQAAT